METSRFQRLRKNVRRWGARQPLFRDGVAVTGCGGLRQHNHRVPRMPIMIDETQADPRSVLDFVGRPLDTVLDADAFSGKMLHLFSDRENAEGYLATAPRPEDHLLRVGTIKTRNAVAETGYIELYEHEWWGGCSWRLDEEPEQKMVNYTEIWACGFLLWGWRNANDVITCVDSTLSSNGVTFAEDIEMGGSWLHVRVGRFFIENLERFGWNDRISSHTPRSMLLP